MNGWYGREQDIVNYILQYSPISWGAVDPRGHLMVGVRDSYGHLSPYYDLPVWLQPLL